MNTTDCYGRSSQTGLRHSTNHRLFAILLLALVAYLTILSRQARAGETCPIIARDDTERVHWVVAMDASQSMDRAWSLVADAVTHVLLCNQHPGDTLHLSSFGLDRNGSVREVYSGPISGNIRALVERAKRPPEFPGSATMTFMNVVQQSQSQQIGELSGKVVSIIASDGRSDKRNDIPMEALGDRFPVTGGAALWILAPTTPTWPDARKDVAPSAHNNHGLSCEVRGNLALRVSPGVLTPHWIPFTTYHATLHIEVQNRCDGRDALGLTVRVKDRFRTLGQATYNGGGRLNVPVEMDAAEAEADDSHAFVVEAEGNDPVGVSLQRRGWWSTYWVWVVVAATLLLLTTGGVTASVVYRRRKPERISVNGFNLVLPHKTWVPIPQHLFGPYTSGTARILWDGQQRSHYRMVADGADHATLNGARFANPATEMLVQIGDAVGLQFGDIWTELVIGSHASVQEVADQETQPDSSGVDFSLDTDLEGTLETGFQL